MARKTTENKEVETELNNAETETNNIAAKETDDGRIDYLVPDDNEEDSHFTVWMNGMRYVMKKGETVRIPQGVKEILERSLAAKRKEREKKRAAKYR